MVSPSPEKVARKSTVMFEEESLYPSCSDQDHGNTPLWKKSSQNCPGPDWIQIEDKCFHVIMNTGSNAANQVHLDTFGDCVDRCKALYPTATLPVFG